MNSTRVPGRRAVNCAASARPQIAVAGDGREDVVEVMGDAAREARQRFHLVGLAELGFDRRLLLGRHGCLQQETRASPRAATRGNPETGPESRGGDRLPPRVCPESRVGPAGRD